MIKSSVLNLIGFAHKSGNLVSGEDTVENYIKKNALKLVILAEDASLNTSEKFKKRTQFYNVELIIFATKQELGLSIGKASRAVIGIKDKNFAKTIKEKLGGAHSVKN